MAKGGDFEREICKLLSKWWTNGERDDIYWRSSQSGGRATQRMKKGISTYGSYGDIAAIDPIGEPLLKVFTIELKRGRTHGHPADFIGIAERDVQQPFEKCLCQAIKSSEQARTPGWMLILRQDHRIPIACIDLETLRLFDNRFLISAPSLVCRMRAHLGGRPIGGTRVHYEPLTFAVVQLSRFLQLCHPADVIAVARTLNR